MLQAASETARYPSPRARVLFAAFLVSVLALGFAGPTAPVGQAYIDPVDKLRAQDESLYAHCALQMSSRGRWATPTLLGRYFLEKPPLLMWLSGLSMKCFGISLFALRMPVLLAGALVGTLVFWWLWGSGGPGLAAAGALLLASNRLWHTYCHLCMTDVVLSCCIVAAVFCLACDSRLEGRAPFWGFAISTAAAVMTKSVAGMVAVLVLLLFVGLMRTKERPALRRVAYVLLLAGTLAAPWHVYQLLVHRRWFWTEYVQNQVLRMGLHPKWQLSAEPSLLFYPKRLAFTDPVLAILAVLALPSFLAALRHRQAARPLLLASWILAAFASMLLFQAHNVTYLSLLLPPLCILSARYAPRPLRVQPWLLVCILSAVFLLKLWPASHPWALRPTDQNPSPSIAALRSYCERNRANELILVSPDDDFYSATLPLPQVRYCFIAPPEAIERYGPHWVYLGVTVSADQFVALDRWRQRFRERLRAWNLDSSEPLATAIVAGSEADVLQIILTHPQTDFFLPTAMQGLVEPAATHTHEIWTATPARFFLLAMRPQPASRSHLLRCW